MKKKGFTLVELLGVLVILSIIALIIVPVVSDTIKDSHENAYRKQIQVLEAATEKWGLENAGELPSTDVAEIIAVDFNTLYTSGQITSYPVINPRTKEELMGCILINYNTQYSQYEYKYSEDQTKCGICNYVNRYADVNNNGIVDLEDVKTLMENLNSGNLDPDLNIKDVNRDGEKNIIDIRDVLICVEQKGSN